MCTTSALRDYVASADWVSDLKTNLSLDLSTEEIRQQFSTKTEITDRYCG